MKKIIFSVLFILIFSYQSEAANPNSNGYKGVFKNRVLIIKYILDCHDYVLRVNAGEGSSYAANLVATGHADVFDPDDTFTVIELSGKFTKVVAHHRNKDNTHGSSYDGWILGEWLFDVQDVSRVVK